jgi:hypothetical protein
MLGKTPKIRSENAFTSSYLSCSCSSNFVTRMDNLTTARVEAANGAVEFTDAHGLRSMFGIGRSLAYQLVSEGAIRSISLRRKGNTRGKRLFNVASVREFLSKQRGDVAPALSERMRNAQKRSASARKNQQKGKA